MFSGDELEEFIERADWVGVNDYEWGMLTQKTGLTESEVADRVKALIVTRGAEGSVVHTRERTLTIPCARPKAVVDPTGCGDAFRAGLIHGLLHGLDWETTGRLWSSRDRSRSNRAARRITHSRARSCSRATVRILTAPGKDFDYEQQFFIHLGVGLRRTPG